MRAWLVCGWQRINARFFLLDLETEAGTYVKEFVRFIPPALLSIFFALDLFGLQFLAT